jgi:hypothetical protein
LLRERATCHFEHGFELGVLGRPQALDRDEVFECRGEQLVEAAEAHDELASELDRALACAAGAQKDRQQLGFRQRRRAMLEQALARSLVYRPFGYAHRRSSIP